uniref:RRM domain-containing protein n=1 Tax=Branchiostoma floridae TaxID=7739 RepID=C3Y5X4_BRAFL|eukprot:XP_002608361.1 hypothetical protein BRAFLDRAFT_91320 [Branchiostoma floridae]
MAGTVLLRGLPDLPALQDQLTVYFGRRGKVQAVRLLGPGRAIVTFAEGSVAQAVACEQEHLFFGTKIKIEPCPRDLVINDGKNQQSMTEKGTDFVASETSAEEMVSDEVGVGEGMTKYLQTHQADGIMEVEERLSLEFVRIGNTKTGFSIHGTVRGVGQAKASLKEMAATVKTAVLTVQNTHQLRGFTRFITKEMTTGRLRDIERDHQCVIAVDDICSLEPMENEEMAAFPTTPCEEDNCELRIGGLVLQVMPGDLIKDTAAGIVVPVSSLLDHSRGIARTVSHAAGPSVLEQCREYVRTEGRPRGGAIVVVGGFGITPERCARRMINGIMEFAQHPRGNQLTVKLVKIVVHQDRTMEAFRAEIFKRSNEHRLSDGRPNELILHFFGPDDSSVEEARRRVEDMVENYSTHAIIVDPAVLQLSAEERRMLQVFSRREKVMITIDEENDGCYHIEGSCDVSAAAAVVRRFLADKRENRTARREILGLSRFQW